MNRPFILDGAKAVVSSLFTFRDNLLNSAGSRHPVIVAWLALCLLVPVVAQAAPGLSARPANLTCVAPERPAGNAALGVEVVASQDISWPVEMVQQPGDSSKWYVVDRSGFVAIYQAGSTLTRIGTLIDVSGLIRRELGGREWNELGLLGMAFHPDFATNGEFFLYYTAAGTNGTVLEGRLSRFTSNDGGLSAKLDTEEVVLRFDRDKQWHWGGRPTFGSDGLLYMTIGDGGTHHNAQNLNNINGKMIRIDVDGGTPYSIPPGNPFASGGGLPEIFAYGFRNPWRWSFDAATGDIWEGDVGPSDREEVNVIVNGGNYGWSLFQGTLCQFSSTCDYSGLEAPVLEYTHDSTQTISGDAVIGGYVYRGSGMPGFYGTYVFGDTNGKLFGFDPAAGGPTTLLGDTGQTILSFAQSAFDNELFILSPGAIRKIIQESGGAGQPSNFPATLSESGCVADGDVTQPASGLIPYDVNVKLWSDGAEKSRWMAVPDGAFISINSEGDFDYPNGTVLIKEFKLNQKRVETRWFVRHDDGQWAGYSFEWDDAETDATLVPPEGKQKQIGGQMWTYPSRSQCLSCHTSVSGRSLGLEIAQLNGDITYPATGNIGNQLETLEFIGMLDAPLPDVPANLDALPDISDTSVGLEERARGYLHANCAMCHRPNGPGQGPEDFRYWLPTNQIGAINEDPSQGDLGLPGGKLISPGSPENSIMLLRTQSLDPSVRMPPLATEIVDSVGTQLLSDWIEQMPSVEVINIVDTTFNSTDQTFWVRASSSFADTVSLTAHLKQNGVLSELGPLQWKPARGYHQFTFPGITAEPGCLAVTSSGGGYDESPIAGSCEQNTASGTPLTEWESATGGVSVSGNQISFDGSSGGWNANSINSAALSSLGYGDTFEVRWTIDSDPSASVWIVGLGVTETSSSWRDVDFGLRNSNGILKVYESGAWRTTGPALAIGDVISIAVDAGIIEYRLNGLTIFTSSYVGAPDFYVDTSFKSGPIALSVSVVGASSPSSSIPVTTWFGATGGVSVSGDSLSYSGTPFGWDNNTVNSAAISSLTSSGNYSVSWTVGSEPAGTTWVVGLGLTEGGPNWRDIDHGLRSLNGVLTVYENGTWMASASALAIGDVLSIVVSGSVLEYRLNGVAIHTSAIIGGEDYYIDSSFKEGAIDLNGFAIREF